MGGKNILVVDDEPNVVRSLTFVLQKEGYVPVSASNGAEAIDKIKQAKPDLVFLDVMMPKMNGYEVCRELRQSSDFRNIHVIMLTAKGQDADRQMGIDAGADEFITKPFQIQEILSRVKSLLG